MRQVVIYPGGDGYWVAECPSLPGCLSRGKTREEAVASARDAIRQYVLALEEDSLPVPPDPFETMVITVAKLPRVSGRECIDALTVEEFVELLR